MSLVPIAQPTTEPISIEELKDHLRVDGNDEEMLVASLIAAARVHLEQRLGLAFITQSWTSLLDRWPDSGCVSLPIQPLQNVDAIRLLGADDVAEIVDPANYVFDRGQQSARIAPRRGHAWPTPNRVIGGIEIDFTSGFGSMPNDVPEPLRQAVRLLASHWFERRELIEVGRSVVPLPSTVEDLIMPYRRIQL